MNARTCFAARIARVVTRCACHPRQYARTARTFRVLLDDGTYDAFIVWADARDDERGHQQIALELTITTGAHKGEVVDIVATKLTTRDSTRAAIDLVGLPCTLVVEDGEPRVEA